MSSSKLNALGIPNRFNLLNHTIYVKEIPDIPEAGSYGDYDADLNIIRIFTSKVADDVIIHTFYHELVHCLEDKGSVHDCDNEEVRCDVLGGLLAQYMTTRR